MIEADPVALETVRAILRRHVPGYEARVFGSRVRGGARPYSDLDVALVGPRPLTLPELESLKHALAASDLLFTVDVVDWRALADGFRRIVEEKFETL
jgi:predicted nucleotidyltransferase